MRADVLRIGRRAIISAAFLLQLTSLFPSPSHGDQVLRAHYSATPPTLDGMLSEEVWNIASPTQPFRQKEPTVGEEASESTVVKVVYTQQSLFIGIVCADSSPENVVATELRRDGDLTKDDSIWILLDSFHDHRNAFLFATNSLGTQ